MADGQVKARTEEFTVPVIIGDDFRIMYVQSGHEGMVIEIFEDPTDMHAELISKKKMMRKLKRAGWSGDLP